MCVHVYFLFIFIYQVDINIYIYTYMSKYDIYIYMSTYNIYIYIYVNVNIYICGGDLYVQNDGVWETICHNTYRITVRRLIVMLSVAAPPFHISISLLGTSITMAQDMLVYRADLLIHIVFQCFFEFMNSCVHFLWFSFKFAVIFILAYLAFVHFLFETLPLFLQVPAKIHHFSEFLLQLPLEYLA